MLSCPVGGESQAKKPLASCPHSSMPLLDANGVWPGMRTKRWVAPVSPASCCHGCLVLHLPVQPQDPSLDIRIGQGHFPSGHFVEIFMLLFHPTYVARVIFPMAYFLRLSCFPEFSFMHVLWIVHFIPIELGHMVLRHLVKYHLGDVTNNRSCQPHKNTSKCFIIHKHFPLFSIKD